MLAKLRELRIRYQRAINIAAGVSLIVVWVSNLLQFSVFPFEISVAYSFAVISGLLLIQIDLLNQVVATEEYVEIIPRAQDELLTLLDYIAKHKVVTARMILYSSNSIRSVIEALVASGARVQVLVQDPNCATNELTQNWIKSFIDDVRFSLTQSLDTSKLEIRLYKHLASFRGVNLDNDLITLGWYTYETTDIEGTQKEHIFGLSFPRIKVTKPSKDYEVCRAMFDHVYNALWQNAEKLEDYSLKMHSS